VRIRPLPLLISLSLPLSTLGIAGCGSKDGTGPEEQIGNVEFDMFSMSLYSQLGTLPTAVMLPNGGPACLTASSMQDSDGDGVPDDSDFTFSEAGCSFPVDEGTGTTTGMIHIADPGGGFGFSATLSNLASVYNLNSGANIQSLKLNGQRQVTGSAAQVTLTQSVQFEFSITGRPTATGSQTWQAVFTAADGYPVILAVGFRVWGEAVVSGPMTFTQNGTTVSLSLSTPTPIVWDPECESPFPVAGEVHAQVLSGGPTGYVSFVWSSCGGEPDVNFIEG
jgi:hypothetical protein